MRWASYCGARYESPVAGEASVMNLNRVAPCKGRAKRAWVDMMHDGSLLTEAVAPLGEMVGYAALAWPDG